MATRPETAPDSIPSTLGCPLKVVSRSIQTNDAVEVAICVFKRATPALELAETAEPALKPILLKVSPEEFQGNKWTVPSYPEKGRAHECEKNVMRLENFTSKAMAISHHDSGY